MNIVKPKIFKDAEVIKNDSLITYLICFFGVYLVSSILCSIIPIIALIIKLMYDGNVNDISSIMSDNEALSNYMYSGKFIILSIFSTGFLMVAPIIYCLKYEKRKISTLGFIKKNCIKSYLLGLVIGLVMFSSVYFIEYITNSISIDSIIKININSIISLLLFFVAFAFQSMGEEVLCRSYLLTSIGAKKGVIPGVLISSLAFSLMHIGNNSFTILPMINIFLFGVVMALIYICTENIWVVSAIHGIWNYAQGNIYGISVSGIGINDSFIKSSQIAGKELINGGGFGAEGGIVTTLILLISILLTILYMVKKNKIIKE